jgi:peptidyl-prolyl cis-trans isomerase SurA
MAALRRQRTVLASCCALVVLSAGLAPASAQGSDAPSIPGLVIAPSGGPNPAMGSPTGGIPGMFVTPPAPPQRNVAPVHAAPPKTAKPKPQPKRATSASAAAPEARRTTSIVALVNDEPITGFNVDQRARFLALSGDIGGRARARMQEIAGDPRTNERLQAILQETINANRGKSREQIIAAFEVRKKAFVTGLQQQAVESARASVIPTMRKKALDELIEERLKLQEARKLSINISNEDVDRVFNDMAKRNKMTGAQFAEHLRQQGADASALKSRLRASLAWREVVRKRYGHQISVSQREIEDLALRSGGGEETQELKLALITIGTPGNPDQRTMAARLAEANAMRAAFRGCPSMPQLAKSQANAQFKDLGYKPASAIAEPTRSLLLSARDGEMLPANLSAGGVELYAVCGRRGVKIDEEKRQAAENQLAMQEFEKLAQRYLFDLRKDALIEMR